MRVIVAGSRDFNDYIFLEKTLIRVFKQLRDEGYNTKKENVTIISGKASGADTMGGLFADKFLLGKKEFPADWGNIDVPSCKIKHNNYGAYNALAGHNRNKEMAVFASQDSELGVLVAFSKNNSKGTKNMIDLGEAYSLKVFIEKV